MEAKKHEGLMRLLAIGQDAKKPFKKMDAHEVDRHIIDKWNNRPAEKRLPPLDAPSVEERTAMYRRKKEQLDHDYQVKLEHWQCMEADYHRKNPPAIVGHVIQLMPTRSSGKYQNILVQGISMDEKFHSVGRTDTGIEIGSYVLYIHENSIVPHPLQRYTGRTDRLTSCYVDGVLSKGVIVPLGLLLGMPAAVVDILGSFMDWCCIDVPQLFNVHSLPHFPKPRRSRAFS